MLKVHSKCQNFEEKKAFSVQICHLCIIFSFFQVSMQDLALSTLFEVVESHKFLTLPRLSSQGVMDQICPPESSKSRKKLCVVLVNRGKDVHTDPLEELKRSHLRSFIQVKFIYFEKATQFCKIFT